MVELLFPPTKPNVSILSIQRLSNIEVLQQPGHRPDTNNFVIFLLTKMLTAVYSFGTKLCSHLLLLGQALWTKIYLWLTKRLPAVLFLFLFFSQWKLIHTSFLDLVLRSFTFKSCQKFMEKLQLHAQAACTSRTHYPRFLYPAQHTIQSSGRDFTVHPTSFGSFTRQWSPFSSDRHDNSST